MVITHSYIHFYQLKPFRFSFTRAVVCRRFPLYEPALAEISALLIGRANIIRLFSIYRASVAAQSKQTATRNKKCLPDPAIFYSASSYAPLRPVPFARDPCFHLVNCVCACVSPFHRRSFFAIPWNVATVGSTISGSFFIGANCRFRSHASKHSSRASYYFPFDD